MLVNAVIRYCLLGLGALLLAVLVSLLTGSSKDGRPVDYNSLTSEAKAIIDRNAGGDGIPSIEIRRLAAIINQQDQQDHLLPLTEDIKSGWYWFIFIPALFLFVSRFVDSRTVISIRLFAALPSLFAIVIALSL